MSILATRYFSEVSAWRSEELDQARRVASLWSLVRETRPKCSRRNSSFNDNSSVCDLVCNLCHSWVFFRPAHSAVSPESLLIISSMAHIPHLWYVEAFIQMGLKWERSPPSANEIGLTYFSLLVYGMVCFLFSFFPALLEICRFVEGSEYGGDWSEASTNCGRVLGEPLNTSSQHSSSSWWCQRCLFFI